MQEKLNFQGWEAGLGLIEYLAEHSQPQSDQKAAFSWSPAREYVSSKSHTTEEQQTARPPPQHLA
jgi:hypothetical protein